MDTRIALGVNPLVIPDQSASLQKALTLNALMGQSDLQGLQVQEAQRTLKRNSALDALAANSGTDEDYLAGLRRIDPASAYKLQQSRLEAQKTQGEVDKSGRENDAAIANAIINASPQDRPAVYSQLRQQEIAKGNKHALASPPEWNEALLPHIVAQQQQGLGAKDAMERADEARAGATPVSPTVAALSGNKFGATPPAPVTPQWANAPATPPVQFGGGTALGGGSGVVGGGAGYGATGAQAPGAAQVIPPVNTPAPSAFAPAPTLDGEPVLPTNEVVAKPSTDLTPEEYRARANEKRALGTKAAREAAKELDTTANQLEMRIQMGQRNEDINTRFDEREKRLKAATDGADLRPEDAQFVARQILAGNQTAGAGLARNQKAKTMVMRAITDEAALQGTSPEDAAAKVAEFAGVTAGQRTLGHRQANLGVAIEELKQFVPIAQTASDAVSRTGFVPLNKLLQMGTNQWSPEQAQFVAANRAIVNSFAQIAARGGSNVHSMVEAENMINTAQTPEQYKAVLKQLMTEAIAAGKAPNAVRKEFSDALTGRGPGVGEEAPAPAIPAGRIPPPADRIPGNSYNTPKGKLKWTGTGWVQP